MERLATMCLLAVVACGGALAMPAPTPAPAPAAEPAPVSPAHIVADVSMMWSEIKAWMVQLGGPSPNPCRGPVWCPAEWPQAGVRAEVCTLAMRVAENADDICRIAMDVPDHGWVQRKCGEAKRHARAAAGACCECSDRDRRPLVF